MTSVIHAADFSEANTYSLTQNSSLSEALLGVTTGKADITFVDPYIAGEFEKNNPGQLRKVENAPVRTFANTFAVDQGETEFMTMWNAVLSTLIADGTVSRTFAAYEAQEAYLPTAPNYGTSW
jgi:ABC-type amino acid transport substrate-binding protein